MTSPTKQRIQDAARELFAVKGVQRTTLQEIADMLGITKPALYYHFASREDLVRSIVQPIVDGGEDFLERMEALESIEQGELLSAFFDFHYAYRRDILLLLTELSTLSDLGLIELVVRWRERLTVLLLGPEPTLAQRARAVMALGGMQDISTQFADVPAEELRPIAVEAALDVLRTG
ncbi:TetR/AcrR family transcriptional regulator [Nonomuraea sp. NPDC050663]|uniref:TetR/AcrR family transcriptional regulator n=1 Tax=Nonomuraea sp. NPDC050663 TaxID=3364370 RepID=UPI0037A280F3